MKIHYIHKHTCPTTVVLSATTAGRWAPIPLRISMIVCICSFVWTNSYSFFCNLSSFCCSLSLVFLSLSSAWLSFDFKVSTSSQNVGGVLDVELKWIPPNRWELVPNTLVGQAPNPKPRTWPGCSFPNTLPKASSGESNECCEESSWLKAMLNFSYINAKGIIM